MKPYPMCAMKPYPTCSETKGWVRAADGGARPEGSPAAAASETTPATGDFAAFWAACLRKEHRKEAMRAYAAALARGVLADFLLAKIRQYAAAVAGREPRRVKYPDNWLNEERYHEDPEPPRPKEPKPDRATSRKADGKAKPQSTALLGWLARRWAARKRRATKTVPVGPSAWNGGLRTTPGASPSPRT
jgi:hypothetical protein